MIALGIIIVLLVLSVFIFTIVAQVWTFKRIELLEKNSIQREKILKDWLFESLYKIDKSILLPGEIEEPTEGRKISVHKPESDPMYEFHDPWRDEWTRQKK